MAKKIINIGQTANDKSGDPLRTAFSKVNDNFTELYNMGVGGGASVTVGDTPPGSPTEGSLWWNSEDGKLYIEYNSSWIDTSSPSSSATTDRLSNGAHEVVLGSDGFTTFPGGLTVDNGRAIFNSTGNGVNIWDGPDAGPYNGELLLSDQGVWLFSNNETNLWKFDNNGSLTVPSLFPRSFTAVLDEDHMSFPDPRVALGDSGYWEFVVTFEITTTGDISIRCNQIFPILHNPGYVSGYTFRFTETDHGIPGYNLDITLDSVVNAGGAGWTANPLFTPAPSLNPTILADNGINFKVNNNTAWQFNSDGITKFPTGTTIEPWGMGWGGITNGNSNNPLSIAVKTQAYPYAGEAVAGVDLFMGGEGGNTNGTLTIYTNDLSTLPQKSNQWAFGVDGNLTLPEGGLIKNSDGSTYGGSGASTGNFNFVDNLIYNSNGTFIDNSDLSHGATSALILPANSNDPNTVQLNNFYGAVELNTGYNNANTWSFGTDASLTLPAGGTAKINAGGVDVRNSVQLRTEVGILNDVITSSEIAMEAGNGGFSSQVYGPWTGGPDGSGGPTLVYAGVENLSGSNGPGFAGFLANDPGVTSEYTVKIDGGGNISVNPFVQYTSDTYSSALGVLSSLDFETGVGQFNGIFVDPSKTYLKGQDGINVTTSGGYQWLFDPTGILNLPNSVVGSSLIQSTHPIKLNANGIIYTFGTDGGLTFPNGGGTIYGDYVNNLGSPHSPHLYLDTDKSLSLPESDNTYAILKTVGYPIRLQAGSKTWDFNFGGTMTLPNTGTITNGNSTIPSVGTILTFTDGFDHQTPNLYNSTQIALQSGGGTDQIDVDWVITFHNGTTRVVTHADLDNFAGWIVQWSDALSIASSSDVWPLTVHSPDYQASYTLKNIEFTPNGTMPLTFREDGLLTGIGVVATTQLDTSFINFNSNASIQVGQQGGGRFQLAMDRFQVLAKAPTSSKGSDGDVIGCIAFDENYIYYCSAPYDGTNNIWHRVVWTDNIW